MISGSEEDNFINISRSVGIKSRITSDSSDSSRIRVHNDSRGIVCSRCLNSLFESFHHRMLDIGINGEVEIDSFHFLLGVFIKYRTTETITSLFFFPGFSCEYIVKITLNTETTNTVTIHKSGNLSQRRSLRILANRVIHEFETFINRIIGDEIIEICTSLLFCEIYLTGYFFHDFESQFWIEFFYYVDISITAQL